MKRELGSSQTNCLIKCIQNIQKDAKAICTDGEVEFSSVIMSTVCKDSFGGALQVLKNGDEQLVIKIPHDKRTASLVFDYYHGIPWTGQFTTQEMIKMFDMASEHSMVDLISRIKFIIARTIAKFNNLLQIYAACNHPELAHFKKAALCAFDCCLKKSTIFQCGKCDMFWKHSYRITCKGTNNITGCSRTFTAEEVLLPGKMCEICHQPLPLSIFEHCGQNLNIVKLNVQLSYEDVPDEIMVDVFKRCLDETKSSAPDVVNN